MKTKSNPVTVLIVDDHVQYRRELRLVLELEDDIEVVGEAGDWHGLWKAIRTLHPDVVLTDLRMPSEDGIKDGIDATKRIRREYPHCAVIIATMLDDGEYAAMARRAGAHAYILKELWRFGPASSHPFLTSQAPATRRSPHITCRALQRNIKVRRASSFPSIASA